MLYKSLSKKSTWNSDPADQPVKLPQMIIMADDVHEKPTISQKGPGDNETKESFQTEKRESLETLVENLTKIIEQIKGQIKDLDK